MSLTIDSNIDSVNLRPDRKNSSFGVDPLESFDGKYQTPEEEKVQIEEESIVGIDENN